MFASQPFRVAVLLLAGVLAAACGRRAVPLTSTTPVLLQSQVAPDAMRAALVRALDARRFTMESEEPGALVGRYQNRGQMLRLRIEYGANDFRITYLESTGLGYVVGRDGTPMISPRYDRYVAQLRQTIEDEIARPERERQEAIEEQRQHELAVAEQHREAEREQREHEARERERDRRAQVEQERLRTEAARAEAEANRPIIVDHDYAVVDSMVYRRRGRVRSRFGRVRVSRRFRDRWVDGQAEGDIDSGSLGLPQSCRGYYAGTPEHVLDVPRDVEYLRLETDSTGDPTLMLVAADGTVYCDDDGGEGLNSRIEGSFPPGQYRVYVGSYQSGTSHRYRLLISSEHATAPAPRATRRRAQAPEDCRALVVSTGHSPAQTMHCDGAEPRCAAALLRAGHHPAQLLHCRGVEPRCAVASLQAGNHPAQLLHCR